jgi:hypothetical protein
MGVIIKSLDKVPLVLLDVIFCSLIDEYFQIDQFFNHDRTVLGYNQSLGFVLGVLMNETDVLYH